MSSETEQVYQHTSRGSLNPRPLTPEREQRLEQIAEELVDWFEERPCCALDVADRGHATGEETTLDVIGHALGVTRERVRQIELGALRSAAAHPELAPDADPDPRRRHEKVIRELPACRNPLQPCTLRDTWQNQGRTCLYRRPRHPLSWCEVCAERKASRRADLVE